MKLTIYYEVCNKKTRTIEAVTTNKKEAHRLANTNNDLFVAVSYDYK